MKAIDTRSVSEQKKDTMSQLQNKIEQVDFYAICEAMGWNSARDPKGAPTKQPQQKHYKVAIVANLLQVAKHNEWHLIKESGLSYVYTGERWLSLEKDELINLLKDVAIKQGYAEIEARNSLFTKQLYEQCLQDGFFECLVL